MMRDRQPPRQPLFWGGRGIFARALDGRACVAFGVVVGDCGCRLRSSIFVVCGKTSVDVEGSGANSLVIARRLSDPNSAATTGRSLDSKASGWTICRPHVIREG